MEKVNNLLLPNLLVELINSKEWFNPDKETLVDIFPDKIRWVSFFNVEEMDKETSYLLGEYKRQVLTDPTPLAQRSPYEFYWFGSKGENVYPGDLDATKAIIIGSIGPDMPFVLDYRESEVNPRVLYFNNLLLWTQIAPTFEDFARMVKVIN